MAQSEKIFIIKTIFLRYSGVIAIIKYEFNIISKIIQYNINKAA